MSLQSNHGIVVCCKGGTKAWIKDYAFIRYGALGHPVSQQGKHLTFNVNCGFTHHLACHVFCTVHVYYLLNKDCIGQ